MKAKECAMRRADELEMIGEGCIGPEAQLESSCHGSHVYWNLEERSLHL